MSGKRKRKKENRPHSTALESIPAGVDPSLALSAEVDRLVDQGHTKSAVDLAKDFHKRASSAASETLLVKAYAARISALFKSGLEVEARSLCDLVRQGYPAAKGVLGELGVVLHARHTSLDDLLRPLNDPALAADRRVAIETALKRESIDLAGLAQCAVLAPEHPLRLGAARLQQAFQAVTTGPVPDDALALPEVSRRSPLAPWKMLVRAIAGFYRADDGACERWLELIDADSAPARLIPALRAMLSKPGKQQIKPAASLLVAQVAGKASACHRAFEALDAAFAVGKRKRILPEIRNAVTACKAAFPDLLDRLKQHISVRALGLNIPHEATRAAMGGCSLKNTHFWHLMARQFEHPRHIMSIPACSLWEEFRKHAVREDWFRNDGPEVAALYLHMAGVLHQIPAEELANIQEAFRERFSGFASYYGDQPAAIREIGARPGPVDFYFMFPEQLYARACAIDPHPETFGQWLDWARRHRDWRLSEQAAEAWRRALPKDTRPLLHLMDSAEKRGALKKALGYLEAAEILNALNPEVRRARLRLLAATAVRHLTQRKANLAERDLADLEALLQAREGDRPAFLSAIRWMCAVLRRDEEAALQHSAEVDRQMGSRIAGTLTLGNLTEICRLVDAVGESYLVRKIDMKPGVSAGAAVARACALGDDLGLPFAIPIGFEEELLKELKAGPGTLDARQLRLLAESALRLDLRKLAFAASGAGLAKGGATEARFLLLRARALPEWEEARCDRCLAAATELARRQRDMALVEEAVDLRRDSGLRGSSFLDWIDSLEPRSLSMNTDELNKVLRREKEESKFPTFEPRKLGRGFDPNAFFDDDEEDEEDPFRGLSFDEMAELAQELFRQPKGDNPPRKRRGPPSPGQRGLF